MKFETSMFTNTVCCMKLPRRRRRELLAQAKSLFASVSIRAVRHTICQTVFTLKTSLLRLSVASICDRNSYVMYWCCQYRMKFGFYCTMLCTRGTSLCLSVTSRCSIETAERIKLVFGIWAFFHPSYTVVKKIRLSSNIRALFSGTLS